jgi:hypothetical protein
VTDTVISCPKVVHIVPGKASRSVATDTQWCREFSGFPAGGSEPTYLEGIPDLDVKPPGVVTKMRILSAGTDNEPLM